VFYFFEKEGGLGLRKSIKENLKRISFLRKLWQRLYTIRFSDMPEDNKKALKETLDYIDNHLKSIKSYADRFHHLRAAIDCVEKEGLFMEFGVFKGSTVNYIADQINGQIFGFDSFEGLPEDWRESFEKGTFKVDMLPRVRQNVTLIKGWFNESLPVFLR